MKVYCKNCRWFKWTDNQFFDGRTPICINGVGFLLPKTYKPKICNYYKRKWWKFWVKP